MFADLPSKMFYRTFKALSEKGYFHEAWYPRYQFQMGPRQLCFLANCVEKTRDIDGSVVEIGCAHGLTTTFIYEYMRDSGFPKDYLCVDTFEGFTAEDIAVETEQRGKTHRWYGRVFKDNHVDWFKESLRQRGITDVRVLKSDISSVSADKLPARVSFCFIDVDIYRPVKRALELIYPRLSPGGIIVVDDCWTKPNELAEPFDGALQAYREFIETQGLTETLVETKFAVLSRPAATRLPRRRKAG